MKFQILISACDGEDILFPERGELSYKEAKAAAVEWLGGSGTWMGKYRAIDNYGGVLQIMPVRDLTPLEVLDEKIKAVEEEIAQLYEEQKYRKEAAMGDLQVALKAIPRVFEWKVTKQDDPQEYDEQIYVAVRETDDSIMQRTQCSEKYGGHYSTEYSHWKGFMYGILNNVLMQTQSGGTLVLSTPALLMQLELDDLMLGDPPEWVKADFFKTEVPV